MFKKEIYCIIFFCILFEQSIAIGQTIILSEKFQIAPTLQDSRSQINPRISFDGGQHYLVVWQQGRNYFESKSADIYATLLVEENKFIKLQKTFSICQAEKSQESPQVVYSNGVFLVVWQDFRNGSDWDIYGIRISCDGRLLDKNPLLIASGPENQACPIIASLKQGFLVIWQDFSDTKFYRLYGAFINQGGQINQIGALKYKRDFLYGGKASIIKNGQTLFLAWNDEKSWGKRGKERITRRFARLKYENNSIKLINIESAPSMYFQNNQGDFAGDGKGNLLYTTWITRGRGFLQPFRLGVASLFKEKESVAILNPNKERSVGLGGWDTKRMIGLNSKDQPIDGPVAVAYGPGMFMCAARTSVYFKKDKNRILGIRIKSDGVKIDSSEELPVLHESDFTLANPSLSGNKNGWLLVFEEDTGKGFYKLWAKNIRFQQ